MTGSEAIVARLEEMAIARDRIVLAAQVRALPVRHNELGFRAQVLRLINATTTGASADIVLPAIPPAGEEKGTAGAPAAAVRVQQGPFGLSKPG